MGNLSALKWRKTYSNHVSLSSTRNYVFLWTIVYIFLRHKTHCMRELINNVLIIRPCDVWRKDLSFAAVLFWYPDSTLRDRRTAPRQKYVISLVLCRTS